MAKKKTKGNGRVKKFLNILWLIGTILSVFVVILSVIITTSENYNNNKKEGILKQLQLYNYEHFGYKPQATVGNSVSILDLSYTVDEEFYDAIESLDCNVELLDTFNIVSLKVVEPKDDIDSVVNIISPYASYWEIVKDGISYYGDNCSPTLSINDVVLIKDTADDVDEFLNNLETAVLSHEGQLTVYMDINYGMMPLTNDLTKLIADKWDYLDRTNQLLILLTYLKNTGVVTNKLDNLYSLYTQLM